jgi:hypothetical protein
MNSLLAVMTGGPHTSPEFLVEPGRNSTNVDYSNPHATSYRQVHGQARTPAQAYDHGPIMDSAQPKRKVDRPSRPNDDVRLFGRFMTEILPCLDM